jgi:hypothetical protein
METNTRKDSLFKALGTFLEAMRSYAVAILMSQGGDNWNRLFYESLNTTQKENWDKSIRNGYNPKSLVDYHNLRGFALRYREQLKADFKRDVNKLPTWLDEIADVRHKCTHYQELEELDFQRVYHNMILIARILKMTELEEEITTYRDNHKGIPNKTKEITAPPTAELTPWFNNVKPHTDITNNRLDESIFAANLAEVTVFDGGREVYKNPAMFFDKTYFTDGMKRIARRVIQGLNGQQSADNRVITLQTGFGGGKTHSLIALYHLAKGGTNLAQSENTEQLFRFTGAPDFPSANIGVFTNQVNDPTQGRTIYKTHIKTIWGELAYQLGGIDAYNHIKANDQNRTTPKGLFKEILEETKPNLILIDELTDYCVAASGVTVGGSTLSDQTVSFMQELSEAVAGTEKCVMVATLPASKTEVATSEAAGLLLETLENRLGRMSSDTKPVDDEEIFEVIRRRLFDNSDTEGQATNTISSYINLYEDVSKILPSNSTRGEYRRKLSKSYPFHPELIDMFRLRWASRHDFQRTRGILRILASIVADLWDRRESLTGPHTQIHTSDVNFNNLDSLRAQLFKLYGNGYDAVISADVAGTSSNAFKIDQDKNEYRRYKLTQGIASTLLLGSFGGSGLNKGITMDELKLCMLKPGTFNHHSINSAMDDLETRAHYLYYTSIGAPAKRYWFHTKPNINILINQAKNEIPNSTIEAEILKKISHFSRDVNRFNVLVNPSNDVPEQKKPALIILSPAFSAIPSDFSQDLKEIIELMATKKGNSERIYRNTILFLVCTETGLHKLREQVREFLACNKVSEEYSEQLEQEQQDELKGKLEETSRQADSSLVTAYTLVAKYCARKGILTLTPKQFADRLDSQIQGPIYEILKDEEWILERLGMSFLGNNNLLPEPDKSIRVNDIYESFLRFDDKPIITGESAVVDSIAKYFHEGEFAIAKGDPPDFTDIWYREPAKVLDVNDKSYWLVDKSLYKSEEPSPPSQPGAENISTDSNENDSPTHTQTTAEGYRTVNAITITGKVDLANYTQIFQSLIMPLKDNGVEIEIKVKGKSTGTNPLKENSVQYKITKESASQLGLDFSEE